ncbi:hypothetical protein ES703_119856 [subsurface metagenome]
MAKQKKNEIWDELLKMITLEVKLEQIYLDPNNPRLEIPGKEKVPDERIVEEEVQQKCLQEMRNIGVTDLIESIRTSGFWNVDRVVLRPLNTDKYVVVEGNRRITALKTLQKSHKKGAISLPPDLYKIIIKLEILLYKGKNPEIAWIIQGFRHTPGIKSWEPYPQSKFFSNYEKQYQKSPQEIAPIFGMKRAEVTHLIRSYHAFKQAKEDEDYGDVLEPDKFGHFYEIILKKNSLKEWMGWDDEKRKFTKTSNLKKYLSLATPKEGEKPKIDISPTTRDTLSKLIQTENKELFNKLESGEVDIRQCEAELIKEESKREVIDITDIIKKLQEMEKLINTLPIPQLQLAKSKDERSQKEKLCKLLENLDKILKLQIKNLKK